MVADVTREVVLGDHFAHVGEDLFRGGDRRPGRITSYNVCYTKLLRTEPYTPQWPGTARFKGPIVHPQTWPEGLEVAGKRVVVIGSGATAATLVPALAGNCAQVTMLQRSPTFFITGRNANA